MSTSMMNRIWWRDDLPMTEKFVAIALADRADDEGVCWPALETIARKCSCTKRTVQNAIKALGDKGLLRKLERSNASSYYLFNLDAMPVLEQPKRTKERHPLAEKMTGESHDIDLFSTGESHAQTGEFHDATGEGGSPNTLEQTLEETSGLSGALPAPRAATLAEYVFAEFETLKALHPLVAMPRMIDDGLAKMMGQRAQAHARPGETAHDVWRIVLEQIYASDFLRGRAPPGPGRDKPFTLSLGWLCRPTNFREVINGKYANSGHERPRDPSTGEVLGPAAAATRGTIERYRNARQRAGGVGNTVQAGHPG